MAEEWVSVNYKELENLLKKYNQQMPNIAVKLMRAVNAEVKKAAKAEMKKRGYHSHKQMSWGDAGYIKNLKSYQNKDFSAKVMMARNAFQYRFIEYGAEKPVGFAIRYKNKTITLKNAWKVEAKPLLYPIADSIWKTSRATRIMEIKFQQELERLKNQEK